MSQTSAAPLCEHSHVQRKYQYRRKLPHRQWEDKTYFITFCTRKRAVLNEGCRGLVLQTCLAGNGKLFELYAVVVMPDHVHLMLVPLADHNGTISVSEIMQAIKSTSSHRINKYLGRTGKVWQDESFDRAMREVENVSGRIEYMIGNPVRASLVESPFDYKWLWTRSRETVRTGVDARASIRNR